MGVTYDQQTVDGICCRLRKLVQDASQKHLYSAAIFYADKLVSLRNDVEDVVSLAEAYFKNREHKRVLHLLKKHREVSSRDARLRLLAVQCLMECRDWDECLAYLQEDKGAPDDGPLASVFALLRGKVYEATENQENALLWYEKAVELDPYCHEALDRLIGNHLLTAEREAAILEGLKLHEQDEWLRHLYAAKLTAVRGSTGNPLEPALAQAADAGNLPFNAADSIGSLCADNSWAATDCTADSIENGHFSNGGAVPAPWIASDPNLDLRGMLERKIQVGRSRQRRLRQATHGDSFAFEEYPAPHLPPALVRNGHALTAQSIRYFYEGDYESCYLISKRVLEDDPYHLAILPVHVVSLVMLDMKSVVFYVAHQLVNAYPSAAVAWFTAGCYYYMIRKYEHARRLFHKALALDHNFAAAWIAYGHAFALHDESDQALAAYRTASRLFPGSNLPWLFIGMEYVRTNSLQLAHQCLECARSLAPDDPYVYNEIAVVAFHRRNYAKACDLLMQALRLSSAPSAAFCANLGHAFLKCQVYDRALEAFQQADRLKPHNGTVLSGIAFTLQLIGKLDEAIEYYHQALSVQRDNAFASEMLTYAIQEAAERPIDMEL